MQKIGKHLVNSKMTTPALSEENKGFSFSSVISNLTLTERQHSSEVRVLDFDKVVTSFEQKGEESQDERITTDEEHNHNYASPSKPVQSSTKSKFLKLK